MKLFRGISVGLTLVLFFSFTSCGIGDDTNKKTLPVMPETTITESGTPDDGLAAMADAGKPVTFKIFIRDASTAPSKDNPVLKRIAELTGVTIDFDFLVGDLDQKMGVLIAGEDYPDAIFAEAQKFIDAGVFIPLEDKLPKYKNLNALYSPHYEKMKAHDGHQYILELYMTNRPSPIFSNNTAGFFIQKAVLEEAGYPIPKTLDEYFELIEAYKSKHQDIDGVRTIGYEILCDGWRDFCLRNPPQHLMGAGNDGDVFVDPNTFKASFYQNTDTAKAYYRKLNEEYHKGMIEAETFTENYDQYISRISTGTVLGFFDQGWNIIPAENILKLDGKFNRTYVSVPIVNPGTQDSYLDAPNGTITAVNGVGITKKCKDPDRLLAFYDWLLQKDVQDYLQWGEEGKDWIKVGSNGKVLTKQRRELYNNDAKRRDLTGFTLWNYSPKMQGFYEDGTPCGPSESEDEYKASLSDYDSKFLDAYGIKYPAQLLSEPVKRPAYYPVWALPVEDGSAAKAANMKMVDICRKFYPRLVLSDMGEFEPLWKEFLAEFKNSNLQPYLDEVNRQIGRYMGK
ncbi:MAG TPA: extracellular solute-binding protein [Clostridia bacterium]|nr:extracellular solute-binding protein [Clostridia bacterium]